MTQTIRYYKEETRCSHCGRYIKNVVEVDGVQYGIKCCDGFIDSKSIVRNIKSTDFALLIAKQEREEKKALRDSLLDYAQAVLPIPSFGKPVSPFFNKPTWELQEWLTKYSHNANALGVIAILQSREITY